MTSGLTAPETHLALRRIVFLNAFLLIATSILSVFGVWHLDAGNEAIGLFELGGAGFAGAIFALLRRTQRVELSSALLSLLILLMCAALLITGGIQRTGIYWVYVFPAMAFFLQGTRRGAWWLVSFAGTVLFLSGLHQCGYFPAFPYAWIEIRQMLISFSVVAIMVWFYEQAREQTEARINAQNLELRRKNHSLSEKIAERELTDRALHESEARFYALIAHTVDAMLVVDRHNIVRFVNPAAETLFDVPGSSMIGKKFGIPAVAGEATELEVPRRDGSSTIVEIRTVNIEWEKEIAYLESLRDITVHKRTEATLRATQKQAAALYQREQQRRKFAETLSEVARMVSSTLDQESVINMILAQLENVIVYHRVTVMLFVDQQELMVVAGRDKFGLDHFKTRVPVGKYQFNGIVLETKRPLVVPDVASDPRWCPTAATRGIRSFIGVPLLVKEAPIGLLTVSRRDANPYTEEDAQTVFAFATQVAIAIHNAQLHERAQERNRRLALLHQISLAVNATLDLRTLLSSASRILVENFEADHSGILIFDEYLTVGEVMAEYPDQAAVGVQIPLTDYPLMTELRRTAQPQAVFDAQHDPLLRPVWDVMRTLGIQSILIVPLISQGQLIGSFSLDSIAQPRQFTASEIELCQTIASQLAMAMNNARLLEQERTRLEQELATAQQIQISLFPARAPTIPGLRITGMSEPARKVGGDFYNYFVFDADHIGIAAGDVSGKGMQAALMMALSVGFLSTAARQDLSPAALLEQVNQQLRPHTLRNRKNTALSYLRLTRQTASARWTVQAANAGFMAPVIRRLDGAVEWLEVGGLPLGMTLETHYTEEQTTLAPGDMLILSSDGVVEAWNQTRELYGFERLTACLAAAPGDDPQALQHYLLTELQAFRDGTEAHDDLTIVIVNVVAE